MYAVMKAWYSARPAHGTVMSNYYVCVIPYDASHTFKFFQAGAVPAIVFVLGCCALQYRARAAAVPTVLEFEL